MEDEPLSYSLKAEQLQLLQMVLATSDQDAEEEEVKEEIPGGGTKSESKVMLIIFIFFFTNVIDRIIFSFPLEKAAWGLFPGFTTSCTPRWIETRVEDRKRDIHSLGVFVQPNDVEVYRYRYLVSSINTSKQICHYCLISGFNSS